MLTGRYIYPEESTDECQDQAIDDAVTLLDCDKTVLDQCVVDNCKGSCSRRQEIVQRFDCIASKCPELDWASFTSGPPPDTGSHLFSSTQPLFYAITLSYYQMFSLLPTFAHCQVCSCFSKCKANKATSHVTQLTHAVKLQRNIGGLTMVKVIMLIIATSVCWQARPLHPRRQHRPLHPLSIASTEKLPTRALNAR